MMSVLRRFAPTAVLSLLVIMAAGCRGDSSETVQAAGAAGADGSALADEMPVFEWDPYWPKPIPDNYMLGEIGGLSVDARDHIWVAQRPSTLAEGLGDTYALDGVAECCTPLPAIVEFDADGTMIKAWGPIHDNKGVLTGPQSWGPFPNVPWPLFEHGLHVDHQGNVWVGSSGAPSQVLHLTGDGKLIRVYGKKHAETTNDIENFAGPASIWVDPKTNEVYFADGEAGKRVIVHDAATGAYKRHWGAYGKRPADAKIVPPNFFEKVLRNPKDTEFGNVHCVTGSNDGMIYACDRTNNRIQAFRTDGTFMNEVAIATNTMGIGVVYDMALSTDPAQRFIYVDDGSNKKIWIVRRADLKLLGSFGRGGHEGGAFSMNHNVGVDSKGNLYVGEAGNGQRIQKFTFKGLRPPAGS